jgi:hypothetical protein
MSAQNQFRKDFIAASTGQRAALVQNVVNQNQSNSQIVNLLANVDYNYKKNPNPLLEAKEWNKANNIFFICKMLNAFPDFKYAG